jgi:hypothetical protein
LERRTDCGVTERATLSLMPKLLTPMFKFYPQDYLMKTATLTLEKQAA